MIRGSMAVHKSHYFCALSSHSSRLFHFCRKDRSVPIKYAYRSQIFRVRSQVRYVSVVSSAAGVVVCGSGLTLCDSRSEHYGTMWKFHNRSVNHCFSAGCGIQLTTIIIALVDTGRETEKCGYTCTYFFHALFLEDEEFYWLYLLTTTALRTYTMPQFILTPRKVESFPAQQQQWLENG